MPWSSTPEQRKLFRRTWELNNERMLLQDNTDGDVELDRGDPNYDSGEEQHAMAKQSRKVEMVKAYKQAVSPATMTVRWRHVIMLVWPAGASCGQGEVQMGMVCICVFSLMLLCLFTVCIIGPSRIGHQSPSIKLLHVDLQLLGVTFMHLVYGCVYIIYKCSMLNKTAV